MGDTSNKENIGYVQWFPNDVSTVSMSIIEKETTTTTKHPDLPLYAYDKLKLSDFMKNCQVYDCLLEITSFISVDLYTNHPLSIRGHYRKSIPDKYKFKYINFSNQSCIELSNSIFLISPHNNSLSGTINEDTLIEIVPENYFNLKHINIESFNNIT